MLSGPNCPCGCRNLELAAAFTTPPPGETRSPREGYQRQIWRCQTCGHFVNRHNVDVSEFYAGAYVDAAYGQRMREEFERILNLPSEESDNAGRVARVLSQARAHFSHDAPRRILDVGSGLCVFLYRLRQVTKWQCVALDPDARAAEHARNVVRIPSLHSDFMKDDIRALLEKKGLPRNFEVIVFNKVLEHVPQPVAMLQKAQSLLVRKGMIYVELPDGECAAADSAGFDREEFHLEHWHAFSMASACLTLVQGGFRVECAARLREPSGKYTLWLRGGLLQADEMP